MNMVSSFFRHAKFQAPLATARSQFSGVWRQAFSAAGRYAPFEAEEVAFVQGDPVSFQGDIPIHAGATHEQRRLHFKQPRPAFEKVENLVVTPCGGGWKDGVLYERYSASKPGLRALTARSKPERTLAKGIFVQSEHTDTFGDWMSEYLAPLARLDEIHAPLVLPDQLARRAYVERDSQRLGLDIVPVSAPLLIEEACVVRQPKVVRYWAPEDVSALRKFLNVAPTEPAPGSILYLSRQNEVSLVADRTYCSDIVEKVVRERGGKVLRTAEATLDDYLGAAREAETLLFDHGSAAYNMVYWRPKRAIEFVSDDWWMNSFLFFSDSIGVYDFTIIRTSLAGVEDRLNQALDRNVR